MNDERDSQLSAMFDNELPETECELLARRLSRDETLQRQWASYSLIGAALRGEPVRARTLATVVRDGRGQVAERVRAALAEQSVHDAAEQAAEQAAAEQQRRGMVRRRISADWLRPLAGAGIAAGVAALSIFWLRSQSVSAPESLAANASATTIVLPGTRSGAASLESQAGAVPGAQALAAVVPAVTANGASRSTDEPISYTVPAPHAGGGSLAGAQLANYVVAHSEFSSPLARRNLLSALVTSESVPVVPSTEDATPAVEEENAAAAAQSASRPADEGRPAGLKPRAPSLPAGVEALRQ